MYIYNELICELEKLYLFEGDIVVRAYYKFVEEEKIYYDFENNSINASYNGDYELLTVQELEYYLKEKLQ